jgi:hypothetical protein
MVQCVVMIEVGLDWSSNLASHDCQQALMERQPEWLKVVASRRGNNVLSHSIVRSTHRRKTTAMTCTN